MDFLHTGCIDIRVVGIGNLDMELLGLDDILTETPSPIAMQTTNKYVNRRLTNFVSQYSRLRLSTNEINEVMRVNTITFYVAPIWKDFPG